MEPPAKGHEDAPEAIVGPDQPVLHAEPPAEGERPRLLGEEGVGPALDEKAVAPLGLDGAAQAIRALEQGQLERPAALARQLHRPVGGRQPGEPAADDQQLHDAGPRRTRSASIATNAG